MLLVPFTLALVMSAAPTLAEPDFTTVNVSADVAKFCAEHLAQQLTTRGVQVTTARQISTLLGIERQKQLLGCGEDEGSCMAELASALGVDGVLMGDLGRLGSKFQVNLRVVKSSTGQVLATWSRSVPNEDGLLEALTDAATELAPRVYAAFRPGEAPAPTVSASAPTRRWPLVPTLVAGGLALASGIAFGLSVSAHTTLLAPVDTGVLTAPQAQGLKTQGEVSQAVAFGTLAGAGVSLGLAVVLYALSGHEAPVHAALTPWLSGLQGARR